MTHIKGYTKQDGTFVPAHEDNRPSAHQLHALLKPGTKLGAMHPKADDEGKAIYLKSPHQATAPETWADPKAIATFVPNGQAPAELNGVPFEVWDDHPEEPDDWNDIQAEAIPEPPLPDAGKKEQAAGVVIEEPDGRVWVIHPSNAFGGYKGTFPKGRVEEGIDLQPSAIKEAFEESGLRVELTGFLCDVERTVTQCRYYTARRIGGTPTDCGWESQAVSLVPRAKLYEALNMATDHGMAEALGAGPKPKIQPPPMPKQTVASKPYTPKPWW